MLFFERKDKDVFLNLSGKVNMIEQNIKFTLESSAHPFYAELLRIHFNKLMERYLNGIAKYYYEMGWHDKASKKVAKQTDFWVNQNW